MTLQHSVGCGIWTQVSRLEEQYTTIEPLMRPWVNVFFYKFIFFPNSFVKMLVGTYS